MKFQFKNCAGALIFTALAGSSAPLRAQNAVVTAPQGAPATTLVPATTLAVPFVQIPFPAPPAPPAKVPSGFADIVRAKFPLSIGYEDLGAGWREITWQGSVYYTHGETTFLNEGEYLVTYRQFAPGDVRDLSAREYIAYLTRRYNVARRGSRFPLSLLLISDVQRVVTRGESGLRSFAPAAQPITNTNSAAFNQNLSLVYLGKIGEALTAYSEANLATLPPMDTAFEARQNLDDFAENAAIFTQPGANVPFKFNPLLSGRKRAHLRGKSSLVIAYESEAAPDGSRAILRLSGQTARVSDKNWEKLKAASQIE